MVTEVRHGTAHVEAESSIVEALQTEFDTGEATRTRARFRRRISNESTTKLSSSIRVTERNSFEEKLPRVPLPEVTKECDRIGIYFVCANSTVGHKRLAQADTRQTK
jgi:hypothetical protein